MAASNAFGFGILGTGMIANVVAGAIESAPSAGLAAVASRSLERAQAFTAERQGALAVEGLASMLDQQSVQAVYIAVPTVHKEAAALAAIAAGKHVLVDKPFVDAASVERMTQAAAEAGLVFMDATHFVHHPRRAQVRAETPALVGTPTALHTVFYGGTTDRTNIRFDPALEPMGALGDLGWYCLRAVVEYLRPQGALVQASASGRRDPETGALTHCSGLLAFASGETATFGCGFETGGMIDNVALFGEKGAVELDDFVMNWTNSFARQEPDVATGFTHRKSQKTVNGFAFIETPSETPQHVLMVEAFRRLAEDGQGEERAAFAQASLDTQRCLDAVWAALS